MKTLQMPVYTCLKRDVNREPMGFVQTSRSARDGYKIGAARILRSDKKCRAPLEWGWVLCFRLWDGALKLPPGKYFPQSSCDALSTRL